MKPIKLNTKPKRKHEEQDLQISVAQLLDSITMFRNKWCHVPNGGARDAKEGARLKKMGVKKGVHDNLIFKNIKWLDTCQSFFERKFYTGLAIEIKVGKGKLTKEQLDWKKSLEEEGWLCIPCKTIDEVMALITKYYGIKF